MALLIMFRNSIVIDDSKRTKLTKFFRYINGNYREIIKFLIVYFIVSIFITTTHYTLDALLKIYYGMHEKSGLSILINKSFSHLQTLILCSIIFTSLSNKLSIFKIFTNAFKLIKKNFIAFILIFFAAVLTPYLAINIVRIIIRLFVTSDPSEFVKLWIQFISPILFLVIDAEISAGTFFSALSMIGYDLQFIFSLPFYIWLMGIFNKAN